MPTYAFRCRTCGQEFSERRPMAQSMDPATCPSGHGDTVRLLNVAGVPSGSATPAVPSSTGGACCGGGCCG